MPVNKPIQIKMPSYGVILAESIHGDSFRMADRVDSFHKLLYVYQGSVSFFDSSHADPLTLSSGCFLPIPHGRKHRLEDQTPATILLLCYAEKFIQSDPVMQKIWTSFSQRQNPVFQPDGISCQKIEKSWRQMLAEQMGTSNERTLMIRSIAMQTLVTLARTSDENYSDTPQARVQNVVKNLENSFYENWDLDKAAQQAQVSRRFFSQQFKKETGQTFLEKLTTLRLEYSTRLLRSGAHSIVYAAFSSGFGDISHFYRLFQRHYGESPGKWLKKNRDS